MLTLLEKRHIFARLVAEFILTAENIGYDVALGEVLRSPEQAALNAKAGKGIRNSLHISGLAVDILLYRNGEWLTDTDEYEEMGEWWERQSTKDYECAWGGRFSKPDGNHFSIEHKGVR
jgi:hypothetical protein